MKTYYDAFLGIMPKGEMLSLSSAKFASPLGLNVLGTEIKKTHPDVFVRIYNLEISNPDTVKLDIQNIIQQHRRVLVGITLVAGNIYNALQIARWLKTLGCDVIVGGPEISHLTAYHFSSLSMIDAVVIGFGEHLISEIILNGLSQKIYTTPPYFAFQTASIDYSLLFELNQHGGVSVLWAGDCHLFAQRCYFCSRHNRGFGWRNPKTVWSELVHPYQHGIRKSYNTADTVAVNFDELRMLAQTKPDELEDLRIKCFINAVQVTDQTARLLKRLNAWAAIGIESFSRISAVGKGKTSLADNYQTIQILAIHGVPMILTFVIGLPGETPQSLETDAQEIIKIVEQFSNSIYWITVSPLLVTLGSHAFDDCNTALSYALPQKNPLEFYNPLLLTEQYFAQFCKVTLNSVYRTIADLKNRISAIAPQIIFDSKGLDPQRWANIIQQ